jgi:hypothetical protein
MLSTLPKLADKAFIVGFFLPTILFFTALFYLFSDSQWTSEFLNAIKDSSNLEKVVYVSLIVWCLSIGIMIANNVLYKIVEGYYWPVSNMTWLKSRQVRIYEDKIRRLRQLEEERNELAKQRDELSGDSERAYGEYDSICWNLARKFPSEESLMPTGFGNATRAFEDYSRQVYGADSIPLWVHLTTVISKEFLASIEDARAQVNFLLNMFLFSMAIFVLAAIRIVINVFVIIVSSWNLNVGIKATLITLAIENKLFASFAFGSALFFWISYGLAIERICEWGTFVKAAFDCYLPDLAKKLGYKLPLRRVDQREFWKAISRQAIFNDAIKAEKWPRIDFEQSNKIDNGRETQPEAVEAEEMEQAGHDKQENGI